MLVLGLASPVAGIGHVFADRAALLTARDAWCADSTTAAGTYGPIADWDVSRVKDLSSIWCGGTITSVCNPACSGFNDDINKWDVSSVTSLFGTFGQAYAFNQPLNSWDVSSVTDLQGTFQGASAFNKPLNSWDVSSVTTLEVTFNQAAAFNQPLNSWDVSKVTTLASTFFGASAFNQPLNSWDVSKVTSLVRTFLSATAFNQPLNSWGVSSVTTLAYTFQEASAFNQPLNSWDVSKVTDLSYTFSGATAFNQPLNFWDVSKVTSLIATFSAFTAFNQPLNSWNVASVTSFFATFLQATAFNQPLNSWNVASAMEPMSFFSTFTGTTSLSDCNKALIASAFVASPSWASSGESQYPGWSSLSCPSQVNTGSGTKDPHFRLPHGGRTDIRGEDGGIYNLLSHKDVCFNAQFEAADFRWAKRAVHGSKMAKAFWTIRTRANQTVTVEFAAVKGAHAIVSIDGAKKELTPMDGTLNISNVVVKLVGRKLSVNTDKWAMAATANNFPFASLNRGKILLDVEVASLYDADEDVIAPHGIFGQAYDGDEYAVDGAIDKPEGDESTTKAQGEGAIEGVIGDYKVAHGFSTAFKYGRFDAVSAPHRDVTKLTGLKRHIGHSPRSAGASSTVEEE